MSVIAGFGFRRNATLSSLRDALARADKGHKLIALATPDDKAMAASITALANDLKLPLIAVRSEELIAANTTTQSGRIQELRNTGSVAEAAALSVAGPNGRLISTRQVSTDGTATCALAERNPA